LGAGSLIAASPGPVLPPAKQALVDSADAFQHSGKAADKHADSRAPVVQQTDPPPATGLLGPVGAPMPGTTFTTTNAWAGWVNSTTYVLVYAGGPGDDPSAGLVLVMRYTGNNGQLDPNAASDSQLIAPPAPGGPLRIVAFAAGQLVIANLAGRQFNFDPASSRFD